jgi:hypothetical protein
VSLQPFAKESRRECCVLLTAQIETIRVNVLGMLNLADICFQKNLHLTTYATGAPAARLALMACTHACIQHQCHMGIVKKSTHGCLQVMHACIAEALAGV